MEWKAMWKHLMPLVGLVTFGLAAQPVAARQLVLDLPVLDPGRPATRADGPVEQPEMAAPPLTLQIALDEALARNPRLAVLRRRYETLRHRPAQVLALAPPSFEAQIWQWPIDTLNPGDVNMYMFTIGQSLPGRGKRELRAAVADADAELSLARVAVEARAIVDEVKRTYADLYLVRREVEIHDATVGLLTQLADVSAAKYSTGGAAQQDVLAAVVELSRVHEELVVLGARAALLEARLDTLLDRPPGAPVGRLTEPAEDGPLPPVADLQRLALEQQPEIRAARLEIERAERALAAERRESRPDYFVKGGYMVMPGRADAWTATLGITWPRAPWARSGLEARIAEAGASVDAARAQLRGVESAIRLAVHDAHVRAESARTRAALLRTSIVPQSSQTLDVSRIAYQADEGDFLALIDSQRVLLDARLAYHRALNDLERARADLERAVGVDLEAAEALEAMGTAEAVGAAQTAGSDEERAQ